MSQRTIALTFTMTVIVLTVGRCCAQPSTDIPVAPLPRAHAHNDYLHDRPLLDALAHGFASAEADIFLVDGQLLVAHERESISPQRSLKRLYLEPLAERIKQNQGRVFQGSQQVFTLLVDIKSDAAATYLALEKELAPYRPWLTHVAGDQKQVRAVEIIVSGNRPRELMLAQTNRSTSYDGRVSDVNADASPAFMPLISERWGALFQWSGDGPIPADQQDKLTELVRQVHATGKRIRFWATPESEAVWKVLLDAGVDHINTDDLAGLSRFLVEQEPRSE